MTIRCAIIDDEPLALELLESYVSRTPFLELRGKYSSAIEALGEIKESPVDLVFVDIQMPNLSGLEFSKLLPDETKIVFTTAFDKYALDGYRVQALDYLLKPISYTDFLAAANKALKWLDGHGEAAVHEEDNQVDSMFVKSDYKLVRIFFKDITYVEGLKDYVKIYLDTSRSPILSLTSMHTIESYLPHPKFLRTHRSYIVNMEKVNVMERGQIVFGDKYIPISDSHRAQVHEYIEQRTPGR